MITTYVIDKLLENKKESVTKFLTIASHVSVSKICFAQNTLNRLNLYYKLCLVVEKMYKLRGL